MKEVSHNTIKSGLSHIRQEALRRGLLLPVKKDWPELRSLLNGAKNAIPDKPKVQAFAPSVASLVDTIKALPNTERARVFKLTLLLKLATGLRTANVIDRAEKLVDGKWFGLRWKNITFIGKDSIRITTSWSKTQHRTFAFQVNKLPHEVKSLCLVRALQTHQRWAKSTDEPILRETGSDKVYKTSQFTRDYRRWLTLTPVDQTRLAASGEKLTPHGLRAVVPSTARKHRIAESAIMLELGWRSHSAFSNYVRELD